MEYILHRLSTYILSINVKYLSLYSIQANQIGIMLLYWIIVTTP